MGDKTSTMCWGAKMGWLSVAHWRLDLIYRATTGVCITGTLPCMVRSYRSLLVVVIYCWISTFYGLRIIGWRWCCDSWGVEYIHCWTWCVLYLEAYIRGYVCWIRKGGPARRFCSARPFSIRWVWAITPTKKRSERNTRDDVSRYSMNASPEWRSIVQFAVPI